MTRRDTLRYVERGLLVLGIVLGTWCAVQIAQARYYQRMPVPAPTASTERLPGDAASEDGRPDDRSTVPTHANVEPGAWVARLEAPSVNMSATILEGSDDPTLARAAGHIEDTAFPGEAGNFAVAGHRDTTFRPVRNLHVGDLLLVTTADRIYHYRIAKTMIVEPTDVFVLDSADHPTLTLVTCFPFEFIGHAPRRFIVSADLTGEETRMATGQDR